MTKLKVTLTIGADVAESDIEELKTSLEEHAGDMLASAGYNAGENDNENVPIHVMARVVEED